MAKPTPSYKDGRASNPASKKEEGAPRFLKAFANTGNVRASAMAAGIERSTVLEWRRTDPAFDAAYKQAIEDSIEVLEEECRRRAMDTSDTLLIFLLKALRPEVYRETTRIDIRNVTDAELISEAASILAGADPAALAALGAGDESPALPE